MESVEHEQFNLSWIAYYVNKYKFTAALEDND